MICFAACSILSLQRELMAEIESGQQPEDPNSLPLSQERLICKAASLSYFLTNEVAVAPVSPVLGFSARLHSKRKAVFGRIDFKVFFSI